ncbi:MAG: hypothetical protein ACR2NN_20875 [Bryobacteraceae bacterium]
MTVPQPIAVESSGFDSKIPDLPNSDAVFLVWAGEQSAYLAKTSMLRRRLQRILKPVEHTGRMLNLRAVATKVEYWLTGSRFESALVHYALAKRHYPDKYLRMIKLRMPAYVRVTLNNQFPCTQVTTRFGSSQALYYGPFRTRGGAEHFEAQMLDLFQVRRCQEDLQPAPNHPGCIYGEMNRCLRPCQQIVSPDEYFSEVTRLTGFLADHGAGMITKIAGARDRLSEEMDFEQAARQHKLLEQVQQVIAARDDLVTGIDQLNGVAVVESGQPDSVRLWFVCQGCWQKPEDFALTSHISLDQRLRELVAGLRPVPAALPDRKEHLALLARWFYSTWRDGEWLSFDSLEQVPYRKLVRAISRVHA